jgi:hypothetical protein
VLPRLQNHANALSLIPVSRFLISRQSSLKFPSLFLKFFPSKCLCAASSTFFAVPSPVSAPFRTMDRQSAPHFRVKDGTWARRAQVSSLKCCHSGTLNPNHCPTLFLKCFVESAQNHSCHWAGVHVAASARQNTAFKSERQIFSTTPSTHYHFLTLTSSQGQPP